MANSCLVSYLPKAVPALALRRGVNMKSFVAVVERDTETGLYVGYVPGFSGAHTQGETLEELRSNLTEVIGMLLEDGEPRLTVDFVGVETVTA